MSEVALTRAAPRGMIALKADLADKAVEKAVKKATGLDMPAALSGRFEGQRALVWMAPDEAMLLCAPDKVAELVAALGKGLAGQHALVLDMSDARALFRLEGAGLRSVLARLSPADTSPAAFTPGTVRRSRLAQVPAAFWMPEEGVAEAMCFRSVAEYVAGLLEEAVAGVRVA